MEAYRYLAQSYNKLMADVDYDVWASYLDRLIGGKELRLFEAGCGTGSITGRLYDMGYNIVASDISEEMLEHAMKDARSHGRDIVFLHQDMRRISAGSMFDVVLSACDGPNYLDQDGLAEFFGSAYRMLKPNGLLLFDISSAYKLCSMDNEVYFDDSDDTTCVWYNQFDHTRHTMTMDIMLFLKQGQLYEKMTEQHVQYVHETADVKQAMRNTGFGCIEVYEAFTFDPVSDVSSRIQFIGHKE